MLIFGVWLLTSFKHLSFKRNILNLKVFLYLFVFICVCVCVCARTPLIMVSSSQHTFKIASAYVLGWWFYLFSLTTLRIYLYYSPKLTKPYLLCWCCSIFHFAFWSIFILVKKSFCCIGSTIISKLQCAL